MRHLTHRRSQGGDGSDTPRNPKTLEYEAARPRNRRRTIFIIVACVYLAAACGGPLWGFIHEGKSLLDTGLATGIITLSLIGFAAATYWLRKGL